MVPRAAVCVATSLGRDFCFDFVRQDAELAARAFCVSCGRAEAVALAVYALEAVLERGNVAEERLRAQFFGCALPRNLSSASCDDDDHNWLEFADELSVRKLRRRVSEVSEIARGRLPEPDPEACPRPDPAQAKIRACPLWAAYPQELLERRESWPILTPADATQWLRLGERWSASEDYDFALAALLAAAAAGEPSDAVDLHLASVWSAWGGDLQIAVDLYGRVAARATIKSFEDDDNERLTAVVAAARLNAAVCVPPVVPNLPDLLEWRHELRTDLAHLAKAPDAWDLKKEVDASTLARLVGRTTFHVAHQCLDEVEDQKLFAEALMRMSPGLAARHFPIATRRQESSSPLRIGFASAYLSDHSIGKMLGELVFRLASIDDFEVYVFHISDDDDNNKNDHVRSVIDAQAKPAVAIDRTDLEAARSAIAKAHLDVLVYPDVGMEPWSFFLAFSRLARVQCVWWGHPVTTGLSSIDFFISLDTEMENAHDSYSEQLLRLDHVNVAPFVSVDLRAELITTNDLKPLDTLLGTIDTDDPHVYLVLGRLFKLHPNFDSILLDILRRDEHAVLALIAEPQKPLVATFWRRFRAAAGPDADLLLPRLRFLDYWHYIQALASATVVLDTYPYGGCLTALDAISNGVPFVTLPGPFERGRFAMSIYRQMNYTDLVASNPAHFVDIAISLGTDPQKRTAAAADLTTAYKARAHRLSAVVDEWATLCRRLDRMSL